MDFIENAFACGGLIEPDENGMIGLNDNGEIPDEVMGVLDEALDHAILVSNIAYKLAMALGNSDDFCRDTAMAGLLHDIGKLRLNKYLEANIDGEASDVERIKYVRMHPTMGYEFLKENGLYTEEIRQAILHHHENYDGSGYPSNLKGDDIPYMSRILRVCDVFAALVSERPYRAAFDTESAIELMTDEVKNFDMEVFLAFLYMIRTSDNEEMEEYIEETNKKTLEKRKAAN